MKKVIAALLMISMLSFAGCGTTDSDHEGSSAPEVPVKTGTQNDSPGDMEVGKNYTVLESESEEEALVDTKYASLVASLREMYPSKVSWRAFDSDRNGYREIYLEVTDQSGDEILLFADGVRNTFQSYRCETKTANYSWVAASKSGEMYLKMEEKSTNTEAEIQYSRWNGTDWEIFAQSGSSSVETSWEGKTVTTDEFASKEKSSINTSVDWNTQPLAGTSFTGDTDGMLGELTAYVKKLSGYIRSENFDIDGDGQTETVYFIQNGYTDWFIKASNLDAGVKKAYASLEEEDMLLVLVADPNASGLGVRLQLLDTSASDSEISVDGKSLEINGKDYYYDEEDLFESK